MQLARIGTEIILYRKHFIEELSKLAEEIHNKLTQYKETLSLEYISNIDYKIRTK